MWCCLWRRTQYLRCRPSRLAPARASPCLVLELQRCCCFSSAFTTPGTASLTTYLSTRRTQTLSGAETERQERRHHDTRNQGQSGRHHRSKQWGGPPNQPLRLTGAALRSIGFNVSTAGPADRKSTRLNSSHPSISYAVFCLKKKKNVKTPHTTSDHYA